MPTDWLNPFERRNEECIKAANLCAEFASAILNDGTPYHLTLLGPSGVGKTLLAKLVAQKAGGSFRRWFKILAALRDGNHWIPLRLEEIPFLVVDDLGLNYDTAFSVAFAAELAQRRERKFTLWTSNLDKKGLAEQFDTRLVSRLIRDGNTVFTFRETRDYWLP